MAHLMTIGFRGEREAARRRQAGLRQRRQIGRLRPDMSGSVGGGVGERQDEGGHCSLSCLGMPPVRRARSPMPGDLGLGRHSAWREHPSALAFARPGMTSAKPTSLHVIAVARQRIDDGDLLDREVRTISISFFFTISISSMRTP